jgi:hypothetical protein
LDLICERSSFVPQTNYQKSSCYAKDLGGCSTKLNKEHSFSHAALKTLAGKGKTVRVSTTGGVLGKLQGTNSIASKILCETHNSFLSPFDVAGTKLFDTLYAYSQLDWGYQNDSIERSELVDGDLVERWMAKMALGLAFGSRGGAVKVPNLDVWLKYVFLGEPMPAGSGLYAWMPNSLPKDWRTNQSHAAGISLIGEGEHLALVFATRIGTLLFQMEGPLPPSDGVIYRPKDLTYLSPNGQASRSIFLPWRDSLPHQSFRVQRYGHQLIETDDATGETQSNNLYVHPDFRLGI